MMLGGNQDQVGKSPSVASSLGTPTFKLDFGAGDKSPTASVSLSPAMNLPAQINIASPVVREWCAKRKELIRPWGSFVRTANFNVPTTPPMWTHRLYKNVEHFQSNYVFVFIILFVYCLISSPFLLIAMAMSGGACWYAGFRNQTQKVMLGGKEIALAQQYAAIAVISIPLFLFAGAGGAVFWVIGASIFLIGLHATFYNYDALGINDQAPLTGNIVEEV